MSSTASSTPNSLPVYEFTIDDGFTKKVGRTEPSLELKRQTIADVYPTEEGKKATVGFRLTDGVHPEAFEGIHLTGCCITNKNDPNEIGSVVENSNFSGAKFAPLGVAFFGPNTAVIGGFPSKKDLATFDELNATGTPEGSIAKRCWHLSVPFKLVDGKWVPRFDDVSPAKSAYWIPVLDTLPSLAGKSDAELRTLIEEFAA